VIVRPLTAAQKAGLRELRGNDCHHCHGTGTARSREVRGRGFRVVEAPCGPCNATGRLPRGYAP
jgi:DnaJ-class molecular chaperone